MLEEESHITQFVVEAPLPFTIPVNQPPIRFRSRIFALFEKFDHLINKVDEQVKLIDHENPILTKDVANFDFDGLVECTIEESDEQQEGDEEELIGCYEFYFKDQAKYDEENSIIGQEEQPQSAYGYERELEQYEQRRHYLNQISEYSSKNSLKIFPTDEELLQNSQNKSTNINRLRRSKRFYHISTSETQLLRDYSMAHLHDLPSFETDSQSVNQHDYSCFVHDLDQLYRFSSANDSLLSYETVSSINPYKKGEHGVNMGQHVKQN